MAKAKENKKKTSPEVKNVLFVTGEAMPFIRSGGLGDVAGALPKALKKDGVETRVIMPLYSDISKKYRDTMKFIGHTYVQLGWRNQYCGIFEGVADGVVYYFIDNEYYFKRRSLYGHYDDAERFTFFSKAVLETVLMIDFAPEVIHCNDWHTSLVPLLLDVFYRNCEKLRNVKTLLTIHNIEFQGNYDLDLARDICCLPEDKLDLIEYGGRCNFLKGGIECSNAVNTVSPTYAEELMDPFYAYGLEGILSARKYKLSGIINGLDLDVYNPKTDRALFANYGVENFELKAENKKEVCQMLGLDYKADRPLLVMVSRLTTQKGLDLILQVAEELLEGDIQLVVLGTGEWRFESALKDLEHRYGAKMRIVINFNKDLSSKLYGAADIFLMPSRFEPCGLSQLIAMHYGTVPVVRETGGLKDTVIPYDPTTKTGTGFTFKNYDANDMLSAIWRAVDAYYNDKAGWKKLIYNGMVADFGWEKSAQKYVELYNKILKED
jgi:starch synthase